jgi:hypothetical protein
LRLNPSQSDWWHLRGSALVGLRRFDEALVSFSRSLALDPSRVQTLSACGVALEGLCRLQEAMDCYRRALKISSTYATARANLGRLQRETGDLVGAVESLRTAAAQSPDFAMAHHNLGCVLYDLDDLPGSIASYRRALSIAPSFAECEYSLAVALLKSGDYRAGWQAFEARLRFTQHDSLTPPQGIQSWDGGPLDGKTLLLVAEAGAGDIIQFSRFAAMLNAHGIRPDLQVSDRMGAIMRSTGYFANICAPGREFSPEQHVWCSLMSLPHRLQLDRIAVPSPPAYLQVDTARVEHWRSRLREIGGLRIGIVWQGNPVAEIGALRGRSMPAAEFLPLAWLPGISLISLQKGPGLEQLRQSPLSERIQDWGSELDNGPDGFVDTAATLVNLDLLITTDTSVAHIAGALGVPTWLLLHRSCDWRWLQATDESPWYGSVRLFRQRRAGEWRPVIQSVCDLIRARSRA